MGRNCLLVFAHPLSGSLCAHLAEHAGTTLAAAGWSVRTIDLYAEDFDPRLSVAEREAYYRSPPVDPPYADALREADMLVFVFPAWWFGMPAILKGFIDRVWAPGLAFDHAPDAGPIRPLLSRLRHVGVIATFGTPWWVDRLVMRRPLLRTLRVGVIGACAPRARFAYLPFYAAENAGGDRVAAFKNRIAKHFAKLGA